MNARLVSRRRHRPASILLLVALSACSPHVTPPLQTALVPRAQARGRQFYVATSGSDANPGSLARPFRTIQHALDVATTAGDTVRVRAGTYREAISFPADGTVNAPIVLENYGGERPSISGDGTALQKLVRIFDRSHVRFAGFDVGNVAATSPLDSGAIFVEGYGDDVRVVGNVVHDVRPARGRYANGRGIQVRGFFADRPLTGVVVSGNRIVRCVVRDGNVLEISGNSSDVRVTGNALRYNRGIALNVTGGTRPPLYARWPLQVHDVVVSGNDVEDTAGAGAIGLYVQGSKNVLVRRNRVDRSVWGIYVTSEYPAVHSRDVTIDGNEVSGNAEAGVLIGSPFFPTTVLGATVTHNIVVGNGANEGGNGGNFGVGRALGVKVTGNTLVASDANALTYLGAPYANVTLDGNCYDDASHRAAGARFGYRGVTYVGFTRYRAATGQDRTSTFGSCPRASGEGP